MPIDRFVWTDHALARLPQRRLTRVEVEAAVARGRCAVINDQPVGRDQRVARIVSVWPLR